MRVILALSVLAITCSLTVWAEERPNELVKTAVVAAGGADVLAKYPAGRVVGKGIMTFAGTETPFTFEQAYQMPGRFRTIVRAEVKGQKWELLQVVNDGVARQSINGRSIPLTDVALKELQVAALLNEVGQLTPLVNDRKFTLKPDKMAKGVDVVGILLHTRGRPDLHLAFDRKTGHLVRIGFKAFDEDSAKETDTETTFAEFREFAGLTRPTVAVVTRDGKKVVELLIEKFTPLEKIDPKSFTLDE